MFCCMINNDLEATVWTRVKEERKEIIGEDEEEPEDDLLCRS